MLVIGLILSMFGIGLFCWLIFTLAVYALPFFIGLTAGMAAFHSGAGVVGALLVGIVAGAVTLAIGQIAFAVVRPPVLRAVIAAGFAIPAAIAGYHAVLGLSQIGVPSLVWREVFAWVGAVFISGTAWARMAALAEPLPLRTGGAARDEPQPALAAATRTPRSGGGAPSSATTHFTATLASMTNLITARRDPRGDERLGSCAVFLFYIL